MTTHRWTQTLALSLSLLLGSGNLSLFAEAVSPAAELTAPQLENLVAPIALYPDELLSQILVASTYPLELVQASQWLQQHPELKGEALVNEAQKQNWDPSVQALVAFPDVLKRLNQDVSWTTNLGNAFLARETDVMDAVQRLRQRAQDTGKLSSTPEQQVKSNTEEGKTVIVIEPSRPDVVYVPEYDPVWIWGPAFYYPYPVWYYPRPRVGLYFWFGAPIAVGLVFAGFRGGWGWHAGWGRRVIVVNNRVWHHDAFHRRNVVYSNRVLTNHYRTAGPAVRPRPRFQDVRERLHSWQGRAQHNAPAAPGHVRNNTHGQTGDRHAAEPRTGRINDRTHGEATTSRGEGHASGWGGGNWSSGHH